MQDVPADSLLLQDHEETFLRPIAEAVFCILDDGRLSLSIATEPHHLMGEAVFTFERYAIEVGLTPGTVLSIPYMQGERSSFDAASTHLYFGTHHDPKDTQLSIHSTSPEGMDVAATFLWNECYRSDSGTWRYAQGRLRARCRRAGQAELRVLM
jgi:hypothetical protein